MPWIPFKAGQTLNRRGVENGRILRDDEYRDLTRITLEEGGDTAPYAITCGVYGWMVHTYFCGEQGAAEEAYQAMQDDLARIVDLIPDDDAPDLEARQSQVEAAITALVARFP